MILFSRYLVAGIIVLALAGCAGPMKTERWLCSLTVFSIPTATITGRYRLTTKSTMTILFARIRIENDPLRLRLWPFL